MKIRNAAKWCNPNRAQCYLIAVLVFALMFALRWSLHSVLGQVYPYQFFFLSSYIVTFFLGGGPGGLVMLLGLVSGTYYFVEPYGHFTTVERDDALYFGNYLLSSLLVIMTIEYLQRARYKSKLLLLVAESRYETLLHRENQRILLERKLQKIK